MLVKGKVSFKESLYDKYENNGEEQTSSSNQITTNNSNNTESINNSTNYNKGDNGNTLIINIDDAKKKIEFQKSITDLSSVNEEKNEDNSKPNKKIENKSLDTIKEENMDDSQSIKLGVSIIKKSKNSSVKSNENQKKYIYNIMGDIYYYSYISKNNNH